MLTQNLLYVLDESIIRMQIGNSCCGSVVMNPTRIHGDTSLIPGLTQWVKDPASCSQMWLGSGVAVAVA